MDHEDHITLLKAGISSPGGIWGEFGSGRGAFTLALAELIGSSGTIYSVDKNAPALKDQDSAIKSKFSGRQPKIYCLNADFTLPLSLPALDGLVIANSLHFHKDKAAVLELIYDYLRPQGCLILVEYNTDSGNTWVPHPVSYNAWYLLVQRNGFEKTRLIARVPSSFLGEIYSAISYKKIDRN
jgi:SAM-dependent methyltransferase